MDEWDYQPTADFDKTPLEKLATFPRHPDMFVYGVRLIVHLCIRAWLRIYHRFRITGRERLPLDRPFAMVANHASHLDAVTLLSALPLMRIQKAYPAAAKDYFFTNTPKIAFSAVVMNAMPFDRKENHRRRESSARSSRASAFSPPARTSRWCRVSWKADIARGRKARSSRGRAS